METCPQHLQRCLGMALYRVRGTAVDVTAVGDDQRVTEAWQATSLRFSVRMQVTPRAGEMIADALRQAGAADVTHTPQPGGIQQVTGRAGDECADAITAIRFSFSDDVIARAARRPQAASETALTGRAWDRRCAECGRQIPASRSHNARTCSEACIRERTRRLTQKRLSSTEAKHEPGGTGSGSGPEAGRGGPHAL